MLVEFANGYLEFAEVPKNKFWEDKDFFKDIRINKIFNFNNGSVIEVEAKDNYLFIENDGDNVYDDSWQVILPNICHKFYFPNFMEVEEINFDFSMKREIKERRPAPTSK